MDTTTTAQAIRDAIMGTDNYTGYTQDELNAGWRSPMVRAAAFQFADDTDSVESLYKHYTYGEDGLPAIGYQSIAEQIAAEAAQSVDEHDAAAILQSLDIDNPDADALAEFIREPYDNGPGFGTDLSTIIEWTETTIALIEKAMPEQWEADDPRDDAYNAATDFTDALTTMISTIRADVEDVARP